MAMAKSTLSYLFFPSFVFSLHQQTVSWETYNEHLQSINLLLKARNFMVFQGDVDKIASMDPKQLTQMFEAISG